MTPAVQLGVLIMAVVAIATMQSANGFLQMSGGRSRAYCESEGSYCMSDDSCCSGLKCVRQIGGIRGLSGGLCQQDADPPVAAEPPSVFSSGSCDTDSDCPPGQCCSRRAIGFRGGLVTSCDADCNQGNGREFGDILGDFYSRYYRRSLRAGKGHHKSPHHHGDNEASEQDMQHQHQGHHEEEDKKKKKKKRQEKKAQH